MAELLFGQDTLVSQNAQRPYEELLAQDEYDQVRLHIPSITGINRWEAYGVRRFLAAQSREEKSRNRKLESPQLEKCYNGLWKDSIWVPRQNFSGWIRNPENPEI